MPIIELHDNVAFGIVGVALQGLHLRLIAQTIVGYLCCVLVVTDIEDRPCVLATHLLFDVMDCDALFRVAKTSFLE